MALMMAAVGMRGVAVEAPAEGGFELAAIADAMAIRTTPAVVAGSVSAYGTASPRTGGNSHDSLVRRLRRPGASRRLIPDNGEKS